MMKLNTIKTIFIVALAVAAFIKPQAAQAQIDILVNPPCGNSTCITTAMINLARNTAQTGLDLMPSYFEELSHEPDCGIPQPTGVIVHKQVPVNIVLFPDTVCVNQGCRPGGNETGRICQ